MKYDTGNTFQNSSAHPNFKQQGAVHYMKIKQALNILDQRMTKCCISSFLPLHFPSDLERSSTC